MLKVSSLCSSLSIKKLTRQARTESGKRIFVSSRSTAKRLTCILIEPEYNCLPRIEHRFLAQLSQVNVKKYLFNFIKQYIVSP